MARNGHPLQMAFIDCLEQIQGCRAQPFIGIGAGAFIDLMATTAFWDGPRVRAFCACTLKGSDMAWIARRWSTATAAGEGLEPVKIAPQHDAAGIAKAKCLLKR